MFIEAIKVTAHHIEGDIVVILTDAFEDVEGAIDVFNDLADEFDELDFADVKVTIEHVEGADDPERQTTTQMKWLTRSIKADENDTLDQVVSLLDDLNETIESFEGNEKAFEVYAECYGVTYLPLGDRVSFSTYSRMEMIEQEIERLDLGRKVYDKIRHLLDDDALLSQAEQGEDVVEHGGTYYVFDN